jgi:hypothetical protein
MTPIALLMPTSQPEMSCKPHRLTWHRAQQLAPSLLRALKSPSVPLQVASKVLNSKLCLARMKLVPQ